MHNFPTHLSSVATLPNEKALGEMQTLRTGCK